MDDPLALIVISIKFLLVISVLCKTEWSSEYYHLITDIITQGEST